MEKIKLLSLFSGIGAFEKALHNLNINYELLAYSEIDKYASKAYSLIHKVNEGMNVGDVRNIDTSRINNKPDLITYGFPCQDISLAGSQNGFIKDGKQTRSCLFFEALRIIKETKPKYAIAENVKNLTSKRFRSTFGIVLHSLEDAGYNNYCKILNSKDFGIPQNRERLFIVSIRKDIDNGEFKFPYGFPLKLRLKDMLEDKVNNKYYQSDKRIVHFINTMMNKQQYVIQIGNCCPTKTRKNPNQGRIYDYNGISPTITHTDGGNNKPMILENHNQKIRIVTPKECFRLMGFNDEDINICYANKISDSQLYKMAGNSIVVDVLEHIFIKLFNLDISTEPKSTTEPENCLF